MATTAFPFMRLPRELRDIVYEFALSLPKNRITNDEGEISYRGILLGWLAIDRTTRQEALQVFRKAVFIAVTTPWSRAYDHVSSHGFVPLLATDEAAQRWKHYHLDVQISSPRFFEAGMVTEKFIILLEDLKTFCDYWFYQDLGYPGLNTNLNLKLVMRDPYSPSWDEKPIPKALQKKLIEPFGVIKNTIGFEIEGNCYESIEKATRERMKERTKTAEECLEEAERLKEEGNELLKKKLFREALRKYEESFLAIHIIVDQKRRSVYAESHYDCEIHTGINKGKHAQFARLMLRLKLVANTIMAFLGDGNWEMARFWGTRTITLLNDTAPEDPLFGPAQEEIGKIYFRTGKACRELKEKQLALRYFHTAHRFLPGDKAAIDAEIKASEAMV